REELRQIHASRDRDCRAQRSRMVVIERTNHRLLDVEREHSPECGPAVEELESKRKSTATAEQIDHSINRSALRPRTGIQINARGSGCHCCILQLLQWELKHLGAPPGSALQPQAVLR